MRRMPLKRVSPKRAAQRYERERTVQAVLMRDRFTCRAAQIVSELECRGRLDVHELLTRARGGSILDVDGAVSLCRAHHDYVHTHPAEALERGLLRSSWDAP